jgi:Xaa-Pro dipeptidase
MALTSMRDRAKPITVDERRGRIERAKKLMAEQKLDAIVLAGGTSLVYFTGMRWGGSERLFAVVIPRVGNPYVVCPASKRTARASSSRSDRWRTPMWRRGRRTKARSKKSPRASRIAALRRPHRRRRDDEVRVRRQHRVRGAGAQGRERNAGHRGRRMIKDAHEVELMRLACEATLKCYEAVYKALQPGMTQTQVGSLINAAYGRLGFPGFASIQVGEYTALPHGSLTPQTIREGTIIMIDDGCTVEGYQSDITRTFVLGKATDKMKKVFDIVHQAQTAALKRRGRRPARGDRRRGPQGGGGRGYGPGFKYFTHRLGHGMGMDGHEWPYLVKNNMYGWDQNVKLQAGMVFSDEPGIYIRGEFRRAARGRHAHHGERRRAVHAAEPVYRGALRAGQGLGARG